MRDVGGGGVREQFLERGRIDDRTREQVRPGGLALVGERHGNLAERLGQLGILGDELPEPYGGGEARGASAHDQDPDLDALVFRSLRKGDIVGRLKRRGVRRRMNAGHGLP